ncbi:MAG: nitrogenase cofactor biosynthesis protein NifB [Candidatus Adiutrix sp.]|jgi:nitrogenase molybdenum-iron protein alpha/beta subunit/MoaA/NifB/PqqE/SkfB family radical SAM enzyme|nr:nitrogenase cofactor biosynthesis protein NifB [Candidatus Adiutrix sp.]
MSANLVNLTTNPCKMCMPLGAATAFYGLQKCMSLLHGSQGCSTYIRRHMATHYNEPVDIASSSLTEEGTIFGGAKNLLKGLDNLIRLYEPEIIGVASTCLAETIGEDVGAVIRTFYETRPGCAVKIIAAAAPGYGGTQFEGYFRALQATVSQIEMNPRPHGGVNIISGLISPADTRALKALLDSTGLPYTLLPDLSRNLDGVHAETYNRLPGGGTPLAAIAAMAGARATLELSPFCPDGYSPGEYLETTYGVPLTRLALPIGLRDVDAFLSALADLGAVIPLGLKEERGRYLDAMADAHKYNAAARAAIFGEPDFVYGLTRLACENGIIPVVAATGTRCAALADALAGEMAAAAERQFVENYDLIDFADFETIDAYIEKNKANILIGSSEARRIAEKRHLPLVRCAFPVHDRVGGQRRRTLLYDGSLALLDDVANAMLAQTEETFRGALFRRLHQDGPGREDQPARRNAAKTATHPCFSPEASKAAARLHLPVASACNISCNYCLRKCDCPNESRPGVTTALLSPAEAFERFKAVKAEFSNLTVVGVAGPGDALADFARTEKTLSLIRAYDPDITFCLSTNGLMLPVHASRLMELGLSHVTVTINAVDPAIGARIYRFVDFMGRRYDGETGAAVLLANQLSGLKRLVDGGVVAKVNIVMLKGVNDSHIEAVAATARDMGASLMNIMRLIPVRGSLFEHLPPVGDEEMMGLRASCEKYTPQMRHCRQCRADAVGLLGHDEAGALGEPGDVEAIMTGLMKERKREHAHYRRDPVGA